VFYQVYPKSFADGNGDGLGDLIGLRDRLDYLQQLGVDALWLSPFYTSPGADGGYDVANPTDVDPIFGTIADFDALVAAAHARGSE
jgi:alpha-glucosidase